MNSRSKWNEGNGMKVILSYADDVIILRNSKN